MSVTVRTTHRNVYTPYQHKVGHFQSFVAKVGRGEIVSLAGSMTPPPSAPTDAQTCSFHDPLVQGSQVPCLRASDLKVFCCT